MDSTNNSSSGFIRATSQGGQEQQAGQQAQELQEIQLIAQQVSLHEAVASRLGLLRNPRMCLPTLAAAGVPLERLQGPQDPWLRICRAVRALVLQIQNYSDPSRENTAEAILGEMLEPLLFHIGRAFRTSGYPLERAIALARLLAWVLDRDPKEAEAIVVGAYDQSSALKLLESRSDIARYRGAREVIAHILTAPRPFDDSEEALSASLYIVAEVSKILKAPLDMRAIARRVEPGRYIVNDPLRGLLILNVRKSSSREQVADEDEMVEGEERLVFKPKIIARYYIEKVKILINPLDISDQSYEVSLRSVADPSAPPIEPPGDKTIEELAAILRRIKNVGQPTQIQGVLSEIIGAFADYGLAEWDAKSPTTGFILIRDKDRETLHWFESPRFKVSLPSPDREKVVEALRVLDEILSFYKYAAPAVGTILWAVQAPLGFVRKQLGRDNKILLNYGEPQVGKTTIGKICGYLWGMREDQAVIGASVITSAQLAERLAETTLPRFLDEVRASIFRDLQLLEMLKTATSGFHIKSRILVHQGFRIQEFVAYASVAMTTNILPILPEGVPERLLAFSWTADIKRPAEDYKAFADKLFETKELLAYIGSYIRDMVQRRWQEVREVVKLPDQVEVGRKLLVMLYDELGLQPPKWLQQPIEPERDIQSADLAEIIRRIIAEDIRKEVRGNYEAENCLKLKNCYNRLVCLSGRNPKLPDIPQRNFLPEYLVLSERGETVYIMSSFLKTLWQGGYDVSLSDLAQAIGGIVDSRKLRDPKDPSKRRSLKVVVVDSKEFSSYLWNDCSAEEQAGS